MHVLIRLGGVFIGPLLPILSVLLAPLPWLHSKILPPSGKKKVLLVARNEIAANHMLCIADLLKKRNDIELIVTTDRVPASNFDNLQAASILELRGIHCFLALICHWDLIIFTNHPYGFGRCFSRFLKKLYINHGIHTGKINNEQGEDGVYGISKVIGPFRSPFYDVMFAASFTERRFALAQTPKLVDRIKVVGFLRADLFLEYARENRERIRDRFDYRPGDKVIHIISTWGENSLYSSSGESILAQLPSLVRRYKILFSLHPRFDELTKNSLETRHSILNKFEELGAKVNRGLDWEDFVIAADSAVSDHSSLCLYHVFLKHPILLAKVSESQYIPGSTFDLLTRQCNSLANYSNVEDALGDLFSDESGHEYTKIETAILSYQGGSAARYEEEVNALLDRDR